MVSVDFKPRVYLLTLTVCAGEGARGLPGGGHAGGQDPLRRQHRRLRAVPDSEHHGLLQQRRHLPHPAVGRHERLASRYQRHGDGDFGVHRHPEGQRHRHRTGLQHERFGVLLHVSNVSGNR